LLVLPFLLETGLLSFKNHYEELDAGYYYIDAIVLLLSFMYLCRVKNPEQLKHINPGEFGKLLGLDRIPEAKCLRKKLKDICSQHKSCEWNTELAKEWSSQDENEFYYIDGHVQVYHGYLAQLGKKHVSRQKLCLPGMQEFWVNNARGMPYFYVCGQVNEKLQQMLAEQVVPKLLTDMVHHKDSDDPNKPRFTIVFDREAYSPVFFDELWQKHKVAVLTYRKNVQDQWDTSLFSEYKLEVEGVETKMELAEKAVVLNGVPMREIRKLSKDTHQTSVVTTHPSLSINLIALYMFARWTQENFFRYMRQDYDFDKIAQYTVEQLDKDFVVVNPAYNKLDYKIKKVREKIARRKAQLYTVIEENVNADLDQTPVLVQKQEKTQKEMKEFQHEEQQYIELRKQIPHRIKVDDMGENQYNKLHMESKLFRNIIKMICYRAETSFASILTKNYKKAFNEKRAIAKSVINTPVDLWVDNENQKLLVTLYTQATPRDNQAVEQLCMNLNESNTKFPGTNFTLVYKTATMEFT